MLSMLESPPEVGSGANRPDSTKEEVDRLAKDTLRISTPDNPHHKVEPPKSDRPKESEGRMGTPEAGRVGQLSVPRIIDFHNMDRTAAYMS